MHGPPLAGRFLQAGATERAGGDEHSTRSRWSQFSRGMAHGGLCRGTVVGRRVWA